MTSSRLSLAAVERAVQQLGERDRAILLDLARVRVLTGNQLTRLHFHNLSPKTQDRTRRNVLSRLNSLGLVTTLERPIGGIRSGSSGLIYALDSGGQRALPIVFADAKIDPPNRPRKPWTPSQLFLLHSLSVSELYVQLVEAGRENRLGLLEFRGEPASWFPNGVGGFIKPDAFAVVQFGEVEDTWAIEVDRARESLPTLRRQLLAYVDFAQSGQEGPNGITPRVLVTVPHERRLVAIHGLVRSLPEPAGQLLSVALFSEAVLTMEAQLKE